MCWARAEAPCGASNPGGTLATTAISSFSCSDGHNPLTTTTTTEACLASSEKPLWSDTSRSSNSSSGSKGVLRRRRQRTRRESGVEVGWCGWARGGGGLGRAASPSKLCPDGAVPCFSMLLMFRSRKTHLVKRAWKARKNGFVNSCEELRRQQREAEQLQKGVAMQLLRRLTVPQLELLVPALESGGADPGECVLVTRNNNTQEGEDGIGGESTTDREQYSPSPPPYTLRPPSLSPSPSANLLPLPPPPHLVMLWLWRWPDLFFSHQHQKQHTFGGADFDCYDTSLIQNLPWCAARNDHVYVCANPYHWARIGKNYHVYVCANPYHWARVGKNYHVYCLWQLLPLG
ncbi:hypothetical protein SK128_028313 [Halocaridina rubra]|uniref:MH1 domain-containing protein n=1 Tax=Halocaridina rubra TaxID=373956 RepID=A0AAN9A3V9_HALRR